MKKLIIVILAFISISAFSQTYTSNSVNTNFRGYVKLPATKTKIGNTSVTETSVLNYNFAYQQAVDTGLLVDEIALLPYIVSPKLTTTEINALVDVVEPTIVYDISLHVFKYYNGSVWKIILTN